MDSTKILLIAQFSVQIIFLGLVIVIFLREKRRKIPTELIDKLEEVIEESKHLSGEFSRHIQEKGELVSNMMEDLDLRVRNAKGVLEDLETTLGKVATLRKYTKSDIVKLSKSGFDPIRISQITGIPTGEVELMLKVDKKKD
ncbi:MAG: hypothetical protein U9P49_08530 [Thermodesulfobacteriota bacterium]|nr:hypothetical protein [Thermodesulfobacteriota bacterium]